MFFNKNKEASEVNVEELPIPLKFDINTMSMFCAYALNIDNTLITRSSLDKMKVLFKRLDSSMYQYDEQLMARFDFVSKALTARVDNKMTNRDIILNYCRNECVEKEIIEEIIDITDTRYKLKDSDVKYINKIVVDKTKFGFIHGVKPIFESFFEQMEVGDFSCDTNMMDNFTDIVNGTVSKLRKVNHVENTNTFNLSDKFVDVVTKTVDEYRSPSYKLQTGVQYLNEILGGGFEKKRLYLFLGLTGGFKSGILLTIAKWFKWYNGGYKTKDPEKTPTVLFITQENTIEETVQRMFNMTVTSNPIHKYTPEEVVELLRTDGKFNLTEENDLDIEFRYFGNDAINTNHIYTIHNELLEEGKETIAIIHDYIGRIKSIDSRSRETREQLGSVANEFKNIAVALEVPFITASQLNREGAKLIDNAVGSNKEDLARLLGRSNIGESWSMLQNVDWAGIIHREFSSTYKRTFLSVHMVKIRYSNNTDLNYFNQPFHETNGMEILDDINGERLGKLSLSGDLNGEFNDTSRSAVDRPKMKKIQPNIDTMEEFDNYLSGK